MKLQSSQYRTRYGTACHYGTYFHLVLSVEYLLLGNGLNEVSVLGRYVATEDTYRQYVNVVSLPHICDQ